MFAPQDLGPTVEATAYSLTALSTIVVAVRFYCRIWVVGKLKLYDFIMLAAVVCTWGLCVVNHYQLYFGSGEHPRPKNVPPASLGFIEHRLWGSARSWYAYQIMYLGDLGLIKLSILVFYLSIATTRTFRVMVHITIAIVSIFTVVMIFLNAFECPKDPGMAVTPAIFRQRKQECFDLPTLYFSQAGFNIASDTIILLLPMPILIKLRMPKARRFALLLVFSAGIVAPVASSLRTWGLYVWNHTPKSGRYNGAYVLFWTQVELNTAIICASVPSLQPLFKRVFGEISRFRRSTYYYYDNGPSAMVETIGSPRRGNASTDPLSVVDTIQPPNGPSKQNFADESEHDFVIVQDLGDEEEIRSRVLFFASGRSSAQSYPPKSPQRPREMLSSG
ncbi:hypothetical protein P154DRAFT_14827 [Amniculicola lignicola CBS 123094]|uniref:Rhodopsin domain-containing protein n=1 Tax=Amniculicola lignicola CBS 123094 TaxID=1392246 RepID=A0A6A5X5E2_9PLEO|nr:hypothetical protein P154DRAFT_14827 [Amniculicola lignicola CBS 123094]